MLLQGSFILLDFTTFYLLHFLYRLQKEIFLKVKRPCRETDYQLHEPESRLSGVVPPFPHKPSWLAHV